jgi:hypothetical protein
MKQFRTQKAQGVSVLSAMQGVHSLPHRIVQSESEVGMQFNRLAMSIESDDIFARPCPVTPRHGFVDSQPVRSVDEAMAIWSKAVEADPDAEMILMPRVNAICNGIYTGNYLALGPGHDGATGGKQSFGIRTAKGAFSPDLLNAAGIKVNEGHGPYVEVVYGTVGQSTNHPIAYVTQLRDGPMTEGTQEFIPNDMDILEVYHPIQSDFDDLLSWEKKAREMSGRKGLVVWHPQGNIACHMAIHCVINNIPYLTRDDEPKVGDHITGDELSVDLNDPMAMRDGLEIGSYIDMPFVDALSVSLFGLHQSNFNRTALGSKLLGASAAYCMRLSTAACLGELRHKRHKGSDSFFHHDRNIVFKRAWTDMFTSQKMMGVALKSFFTKQWKSGYGGVAWGVCTMKNMELWDASLALHRSPDMERFKEVVARLNDSINTIHNNGWLFNKFTNPQIMDAAANSRPDFVINSGLAIYKTLTAVRPEDTGWKNARKTRALTELRKKMDIDEIARKRTEHAAIKLAASHNPALHKELIQKKKAELLEQMKAKEIESKEVAKKHAELAGEVINIQAYVNAGGEYIHFQWTTTKGMTAKGYFSADIARTNENLKDESYETISQNLHDTASFSVGSNSKYFKCHVNDGIVFDCQNTPIVDMNYLWLRYVTQ